MGKRRQTEEEREISQEGREIYGTTTYFGRKVAGYANRFLLHRAEPSRADRLIADVQSGVVYIVVNFIGTRGKEGRRKISIAKRKQLAATLADKTPNTGRGGHSGGKK